MKIVFFGTPTFAVTSLERLLLTPAVEVLAVVTQPDRPRGRGGKLSAPPVKELALSHNLPVLQPERLRRDEAVLAQLEAYSADFFVVVAYGQILSKRVLAMPRLGCINVHGSLLPKYRGAAPVQWAIFHGETETGVTTMLMDAGLDTGPMLRKRTMPIPEQTNSVELLAKLADMGADLLVETLRDFSQITPEPQNDLETCYAPLITPADCLISWQETAQVIHNRVRAFYPEVHIQHRGQRLKILATKLFTSTQVAPPGTITQLHKNLGFSIATGSAELLITQVHPAGKRPQSAWDYANGCRLQVGERL
jgi:methionyl-tRNA formyltransferase